MHDSMKQNADASGLRIAIAVSQYHREITQSMCDAASQTFRGAGGRDEHLTIVEAAGTYELTALCRALAMAESRLGRPTYDAIVALGCVIAGQTTHDQHIARSVTHGLTAITVETGVPIGFGVLTCQTLEQARERSVGAGARNSSNKGAEAMLAAIATATTIKRIQAPSKVST